jgi:hypothetical protein
MHLLLHDPERLFETVDIIASPMPGRAIARCYKAPIPPDGKGVSAKEDVRARDLSHPQRRRALTAAWARVRV